MTNDLQTSEIRQALGAYDALPLEVLQATDSTNRRLKEAARDGLRAPFLLIADTQSAGRGRLGRQFVSPPGTGLYLSMLLPMPEQDALPPTVTAAAAVARASWLTCGMQVKIKWVNDLFLRGKKVCGILAESAAGQIVLGIGVNVRTPPGGFPGLPIAGALDAQVSRGFLAGRVAACMLDALKAPQEEILTAYRENMLLLRKSVTFVQNGMEKTALATGIDAQGGLIVTCDGRETVLRCGEVSLHSDSFLGLE